MMKKLSLKLLAFLGICLMTVFCILLPSPAYANPGVCEDARDQCKHNCGGVHSCESGCESSYRECLGC